jgi:hypothetical protein
MERGQHAARVLRGDPRFMAKHVKPMEGQRFGKLVILRRAPMRPKMGARWWARCDCGKEVDVLGVAVRVLVASGKVPSCDGPGCKTRGSHVRPPKLPPPPKPVREVRCACGVVEPWTKRGKPLELCATCRAKRDRARVSTWQKRERAEAIAEGFCGKCRKRPRPEGRRTCATCREKQNGVYKRMRPNESATPIAQPAYADAAE